MRSLLVALALLPSVAHAGDALTGFVADLSANKPSTHLTGCELLVTPSGDVRQPCTLAITDLVSEPGATLSVKKTKRTHVPKSQMMWREAEVEARVGKKLIATYRVVEIEGMGAPGDQPGIIAAHWARLTPDRDAQAVARKPTVADKVSATKVASADRNQAVESVQQFLRSDRFAAQLVDSIKQRAIVFGSAAGQRYAGAAGAKAVADWKIDLVPDGKVTVGGNAWVLAGVTTISAMPHAPKAAELTYVVFVAFTSSLTRAGSFLTEPAIVSFAIAR